jgi:multiple sugar transport system ATP-binding protein
MASIALEHVDKIYPDGTHAVTDLSLDVHDGEFVVLVGPSGCGKTTALRMVAGLEEISDGLVRIGEKVVNDLDPRERDIAMVFQNYALYPNMTVAENIGFGLRMRKIPKEQRGPKIEDAARILGLTEYLHRKPSQLSGGQRQRVAMGRAIVREPQAFLMDEPLSNLDAKLRVQMRADIAKLQHELGTTTIYVTHDQVEAMTMGDRVAVMKSGVLQQVDAPQRLYDLPANIFVAGFIGSPPMNLLQAQVSVDSDAVTVTLAGTPIKVAPDSLRAYPGLRQYQGGRLVVGIRSRDLYPASERPDLPTLNARVELVEALGSGSIAYFWIDAMALAREEETVKDVEGNVAGAVGGTQPNLVAEFPPHATLTIGDTVPVAIDPARLHFFDESSGEPLR